MNPDEIPDDVLGEFLGALESDERAELSRLMGGPRARELGDFLYGDILFRERNPVGPAGRPAAVFGGTILLDAGRRGGCGVVHRAWDIELAHVVALKRPRGAIGEADLVRFLDEARAAAGVHHRHVIPVFRFGFDDGVPFFTMPWCERGTLDGPCLPPRGAARVVALVADAVAAAHARGVWHLDLKPSNVLLGDAGEPLVSDFGLALRVTGLDPADYRGGTPGYMSPEQSPDGTGEVTAATDVFGLGAVLFALLYGRPPGAAAPPGEAPRLPPADLAAICGKCLAPNPADRYAGPADVAADLRAFLGHYPTRANPPGRLRRLWLWMRRHPLRAAAALTACLLLLLSWEIVRQRDLAAAEQSLARERAELFRDLDAETSGRPPAAGWRDRSVARLLRAGAVRARDDGELRARAVRLLRGIDAKVVASRSQIEGIEARHVAFDTAGGRRRVLLGGDGTPARPTRLWDFAADTVTAYPAQGTGPVGFRDGRAVHLSARAGRPAELRDLERGDLVFALTVPSGGLAALKADDAPALTMTPDAAVVAYVRAGQPYRLEVADVRSGRVVLSRALAAPRCLALSADGSLVAAAADGGAVEVIRVADGTSFSLPVAPGREAHSMAFDRSGGRLAVGQTGCATVYSCADRREEAHCHGVAYDATAVAWTGDGAMLLVACGGDALLFDAHKGDPLLSIPASDSLAVAADAEGRLLVAPHRKFGGFQPLQVWQVEAGRGTVSPAGLVGRPTALAADDEETTLAVLTQAWQVAVFDLRTGRVRDTFFARHLPDETPDNCGLAVRAAGREVWTASAAGAVCRDVAARTETAWDLPASAVVCCVGRGPGPGAMMFRAEGKSGTRRAVIHDLRPGRPAARAAADSPAYRRITKAVASDTGFVYYACGPDRERHVVAIDAGGAERWRRRFDQEGQDGGPTFDASGRELFLPAPDDFDRAVRLSPETGDARGSCAFPMAYHAVASVGYYPAGPRGGHFFADSFVGRDPLRPLFRLGPVACAPPANLLTRSGRLLVRTDARGEVTVCDLPAVTALLAGWGLSAR